MKFCFDGRGVELIQKGSNEPAPALSRPAPNSRSIIIILDFSDDP